MNGARGRARGCRPIPVGWEGSGAGDPERGHAADEAAGGVPVGELEAQVDGALGDAERRRAVRLELDADVGVLELGAGGQRAHL
jgi:hypothetical protein